MGTEFGEGCPPVNMMLPPRMLILSSQSRAMLSPASSGKVGYPCPSTANTLYLLRMKRYTIWLPAILFFMSGVFTALEVEDQALRHVRIAKCSLECSSLANVNHIHTQMGRSRVSDDIPSVPAFCLYRVTNSVVSMTFWSRGTSTLESTPTGTRTKSIPRKRIKSVTSKRRSNTKSDSQHSITSSNANVSVP